MGDHSTKRRRTRALLGLVGVSVLVAAACGGDDDSSGETLPPAGTAAAGATTTPGQEAGAGGAEDAGGMSIAIDEPADGADVGGEFDVRMSPSVEVGEPETGLHHIHLYYDGNTNEGEYGIVYGNTFTVSGLAPGEHTIEAVIANADHSLTDTRTSITVNVTEGGAGGPGTATTAPLYDY
jgi:hypothetical protein